MPPSDLRLESFISTDKVIYKATDVVFIEVLVIDTMKKTPFLPTPNVSQEIQI